MNKEEIRHWTKNIVARDMQERNPQWQKIQATYHLDYQRPAGTMDIEGYHAVIDPQPYKDITVAKNSRLRARLKVKIKPWAEKFAGKEVANEREQSLLWWLNLLDNRRGGSVKADILESAVLYGAVCLQVLHVGYMAQAQKEKLGQQVQYRRQHGPFAVAVLNPLNVHWQTSLYGLQRVVSVKTLLAQEVLDTWGSAASGLKKKLDANKGADKEWQFKYVTEYYYCDLERVYVWCVPSLTATPAPSQENLVDVLWEKNELGFINWICEDLGSSLETDGKYKHKPLLWYIAESGIWQTACTIKSMGMTQGIQNMGKPDWKHTGPVGAEKPYEMDYKSVAGGVLHVSPGHTLDETQPVQYDPNLQVLQTQLGNDMAETGVSAALAGSAEAETYAGQNMLYETGQASIAGMDTLTCKAYAEICYQMLRWLEKNDQPEYARGVDKGFEGQEYMLNPAEIDVDNLQIEVELSTVKEGTKIQQANTATLAVQSLGLSRETALEWVDITDPQKEMKQRAREEFIQYKQQERIRELQAAQDLRLQQQQMEMQMQMQQQMLPPPEEAGLPQEGPYPGQQPFEAPFPPSGNELPMQGGNPGMGGVPNAFINPTATFEGQNGGPRP